MFRVVYFTFLGNRDLHISSVCFSKTTERYPKVIIEYLIIHFYVPVGFIEDLLVFNFVLYPQNATELLLHFTFARNSSEVAADKIRNHAAFC